MEGQGRRSKVKCQIVFSHHCYLVSRSRSKVGVKVKGHVQSHGLRSRSILEAWLCQVQQIVSGRMWLIERMRSIGF